jgi:hypothetical protein
VTFSSSSIASAALTIAIALGSFSCSGHGSNSGAGSGPQALNVAGQWDGSWADSNGVEGGGLSMVLAQNGVGVTGTASFEGSHCFSGCSMSGTMEGSSLMGGMMSGGIHMSFALTMTGPGDNEMTGFYAVNSNGACAGVHGTATLMRH